MLLGLLQQTTQRNPAQPALICGGSSIPYQTLYEQVGGVYHGLKRLGVGQGDTIVVALPNSAEFVLSFYAAAALGALLLPLNPFLSDREMTRYISEHPGTTAIITDGAWLQRWQQTVDQVHGPGTPAARAIALVAINAGGPAAAGPEAADPSAAVDFQTFLQQPAPALPRREYSGDFLLQYSSGSTGAPKLLRRTQANLFHQAQNCTQTIGVAPTDAILALVPLYHAYGIGECLLAATATGAALVIAEPAMEENQPVQTPFVFRRDYILELIDRHRVTILPLVPYMVSVLAATPPDHPASLASVRWCFSAGTFLTEEVFAQFRRRWGIAVRQLYGCTEAGAVAVNLEAENGMAYNAIGQPMANVDIRIVDDEGRSLPAGQVGQLAIQSRTIAAGHAQMHLAGVEMAGVEMAAANGHGTLGHGTGRHRAGEHGAGGYFLTGDLARRDAQGRIYIVGRQRSQRMTAQHKSGPLERDPALQEA